MTKFQYVKVIKYMIENYFSTKYMVRLNNKRRKQF